MLTWPHAATDWGDRLDRVMPVFAGIGSMISRHEILLSVCHSRSAAREIADLLLAAGARSNNLRFAVADSDDTWARDHGPITTLDSGSPVLHDFQFNGWGDKFDAANDNRITQRLYAEGIFSGTPVVREAFVLEGGAIETDGLGTVLATRSSVINDTRNQGFDTAAVEDVLRATLGVQRCLWLDHGDISGDDTDGHIDTLARFVSRDTIVYASAPEGDVDQPALKAMAEQLHRLRNTEGRPYALHPLPFPGVHVDDDGRRLPATYANFLFLNDALLLPIYMVAQDAEAIALFERLCPNRRILPIDCREIIRQNGSLHCLTMQFPQGIELHDTLENFIDAR
jgi:agmatine/peptidylarginine deiminase